MKDIERIISELEQQKSAIDRAITALREVTGSSRFTAPRGLQAPATKKKRRMSAAGRQRIAEGVRKRWAARKSAQAAESGGSAAALRKLAPGKKARRKRSSAKKSAAKKSAAKAISSQAS